MYHRGDTIHTAGKYFSCKVYQYVIYKIYYSALLNEDKKATLLLQRRVDLMSRHSDNECVLITFHGQESWRQATSTALWTNTTGTTSCGHLWLVKIGFSCSPLLKTLHALCTQCNFVHRAIGLVCIHISWP